MTHTPDPAAGAPSTGTPRAGDAVVFSDTEPAEDQDTAVSTQHTVTINGQVIPYTATAGTVVLDDSTGAPGVRVFYVAYTRDDVDSSQPVSFLFNGGPGSPSSYLHLASVGPVRVETAEAAPTPANGYSLIPNEHSILDRTDLVFIDAPGTGFSEILSEEAERDFFGVD
ncbi:MAG: S10 family serine carboxypeptidase-like protein, partial [Mycetocola sp.]